MKHNVTFVTGLWDLGRDNLGDFSRPFNSYLDRFAELLSLDINLVVFVPESLETFVAERRNPLKTVISRRNNEDFEKCFDFYHQVQNIRKNPDWYNQVDWLSQSPQAKLELYNPVVMCKMFMLHTASCWNHFNTDYFFWIDAGLTNTVGLNFLQNLNNVTGYMQQHGPNQALFITYPYVGNTEIHGFKREPLAEFCNTDYVGYVPRGGFFGGAKSAIDVLNGEYWGYLHTTLNNNLMGTEESIFCILCHRRADQIHRYEIEDNGLVWPFFNNLTNYQPVTKNAVELAPRRAFQEVKTSLYILTYNSPEQLEALLWSFEHTDQEFLKLPKLYLINNSINQSTTTRYQELCDRYNIEHIKFNNLGVCGGRQYVAEHFHQSDSDYYVFFEDDMLLFPISDGVTCRSGYRTYIQNLYRNSLHIVYKEDYDYLKLTYSEFFGTNKKQWAWYNIDDRSRRVFFPEAPIRSEHPNSCPDTICTAKKTLGDIEYFEGEYHYCNWPSWISRRGNYKIFIESPLKHPYEQVWMANVFHQLRANELKAAVLALSPINHNRFVFYHAEERKES